MSDYLCPEFKIGLTQGGMTRLPFVGIPDPQKALFAPYTVLNVAGDKQRQGDGFPVATWTWTGLTRDAVYALLSYVPVGYASATVYIRTLVDPQLSDWKNYRAVLQRPDLTGADGEPAEQTINAYLNLSAKFFAMVAL